MKKKLEADLISIAHRVLKLKNKSDINQLYLETQKLYEKLSILRFVDEHFSEAKPTIGHSEIGREIESIFEKTSILSEPKIERDEAIVQETIDQNPVVEQTTETPFGEIEKIAPIAEESTINNFDTIEEQKVITATETIITEKEATETDNTEQPIVFEETLVEEKQRHKKTSKNQTDEDIDAVALSNEESMLAKDILEEEVSNEESQEELKTAFETQEEKETTVKQEAVQISFEDLLGSNYHDTLFVKKQQVDNIPTTIVIDTPKEQVEEHKLYDVQTETTEKSEPKIVSLNEKLAKGINIDLNDRLAFIKHLFGNSSEDYNRVLSQLITFDTFYETRDFVQEMVKPDYNNWEGKQEYEERFMDIIEKKFL